MRKYLAGTAIIVLLFGGLLSFSQQSPGPQSPTSPLSVTDVEHGLKAGVSNTRMAALVKQYGLDFELNDAVEKQLRTAGANDELLLSIRISRAGVKPVSIVLPTEKVVSSFLYEMFGYDPSISWKIVSITASESTSLAEVNVILATGKGQQATKFYVSADGKHAVVGDVMAFGKRPFDSAAYELQKEVNGAVLGSTDALITVVEFADLQCPHCKEVQPTIEKLVSKPNVRLVFQNFPLSAHDWARKGAAFSDCIGRDSSYAFWKFVSNVYNQQGSIDVNTVDEKLSAIAASSGANVTGLKACIADPETEMRVQHSLALGRSLGIKNLPTLFIGGRKVEPASVPYAVLQQMVSQTLNDPPRLPPLDQQHYNLAINDGASAGLSSPAPPAGSVGTAQPYQASAGSASPSSSASTDASAGADMSAVRTNDGSSGGSGVEAHDCLQRTSEPTGGGEFRYYLAFRNTCAKPVHLYYCYTTAGKGCWGCVMHGQDIETKSNTDYSAEIGAGCQAQSCSELEVVWNATYVQSKGDSPPNEIYPKKPNVDDSCSTTAH